MALVRIDSWMTQDAEAATAWERLETADVWRWVVEVQDGYLCVAAGHADPDEVDGPAGWGARPDEVVYDSEATPNVYDAVVSYALPATIFAVASQPRKRPSNRLLRMYRFLKPEHRNTDPAAVDWDNHISFLTGPSERVDTYVGGLLTIRSVYGPGQTELHPVTGRRVARDGESPFAVETHTWTAGLFGPVARNIAIALLRLDGTTAETIEVAFTFDADESKRRGKDRRRQAWAGQDGVEDYLGSRMAKGIDPGWTPAQIGAYLANEAARLYAGPANTGRGLSARELFVSGANAGPAMAHLTDAATWIGDDAIPWLDATALAALGAILAPWLPAK